MKFILEVSNLSKRYSFGGQRHASPEKLPPRPCPETFWALKDISFKVEEGQVVGILGRNGAGKSTLLKILSRITAPTAGKVVLRGRVTSLLEVGSGFHPDLTGRENVYTNGAIHGMRKWEIERKFDEIVAFSEIEDFIDMPVKHYSSGMYTRLAFSVAAHLDPEILIVDEVLAVGDASFRKKSMGKIDDVSKAGRTVIFVSHQLTPLAAVCEKGLWLEKGNLVFEGSIHDTIARYQESITPDEDVPLADRKIRLGSGDVRYLKVEIKDTRGQKIKGLVGGQPFRLMLSYKNNTARELKDVDFSVGFYDEAGQKISHISSQIGPSNFESIKPGEGSIEAEIKALPLVPGRYRLNLSVEIGGERSDWIQNAVWFEILPRDYYGTGKSTRPGQGSLFLDYFFKAA